MSKRVTPGKNTPARFRSLSIFAILLAVPVLAIGGITVVRQREVAQQKNQDRSYHMADKSNGNMPTIKVVGQDVHVDGETGQL